MNWNFTHLIDAKKLIKLDSADTPSWDYFISAYNDSERVKTVFLKINACSKYWLILPEYDYSEGELPKDELLPKTNISREDDIIIAAFEPIIEELKDPNKKLCIDVTGMMRPHILFLLFYLKSQGINDFDMLYSEPQHYRSKEETEFASDDVSEVRQVSGFEGDHIDSDKDILIVGLGYDHHLISHVIENKSSAQLLQLHSLPSLSADMYQESLLRLNRVSSSYTSSIPNNQIYCTANDPFLVATLLCETIDRITSSDQADNIYLCPLATKPQAIGFGLYCLKSSSQTPTSIIFPSTSKYDRETSKGIGRIWTYPIHFEN